METKKKDGAILTQEQMEEVGIELEIEEVQEDTKEKKFELICEAGRLSGLEADLGREGFAILSSEIEFRAVHPIDMPEAEAPKIEKLYEMLQVRFGPIRPFWADFPSRLGQFLQFTYFPREIQNGKVDPLVF